MIKPTAVAKLFATILAVALLGVVFAAPGIAVEGTEEGGQAAPAEPETQGAPDQPDGTEQPAPDTSGTEEDGSSSSGDTAKPTQEEQDRFDRYCNQPNAQPSHSDAQFCEDFKKRFSDTSAGASSTGGPTQEEKDRYQRYCTSKDSEPSHNDKKFCEDYEKKYPKEAKAESAAANNEQATNAENEDAKKKEDEPNSGPLAFTGLDVWQLVLLGMVLVGGGLGARKLLAN